MSTSNCLFCKIAQKELATDFVYEEDDVLAFNDINPQAPTHILIIPKKHIATINDADEDDLYLLGKMNLVAARIAKDLGLADNGFRTVMNCNIQGGQTVYHIHLHLLAGRQMGWPPG